MHNPKTKHKPMGRAPLILLFLAAFLLPPVAAEPIPVPGPGTVGTPEAIDIPQVCDPLPVLCVGPIHLPAPVAVLVQAHGFVLVIDPAGNPGSALGPFYQNATIPVLNVTVPIIVCPVTCQVPASPTAALDGNATLQFTGPRTCTVVLSAPAPQAQCSPACPAGEGGVTPPACYADDDGDGVPNEVDFTYESCEDAEGDFYICKTTTPGLLGLGLRIYYQNPFGGSTLIGL